MERTVKIEVEMPDCFIGLLEFIFGCQFDAIPEEINSYITDATQSTGSWLNQFAVEHMVTYYPRVSMFAAEDHSPYEHAVYAQIENEIMHVDMGRGDHFINTLGLDDRVELIFSDRRQSRLKLCFYKNAHPTKYLHATVAWLVKKGYVSPRLEEYGVSPLMAIDFLQERAYDEEVMRGLCEWMLASSERVDQVIHYCHEHNANDILVDLVHRHNEFKKQQKRWWFDTKEMTFRL